MDDVIAIFAPVPVLENEDYRELINKELGELELEINEEKTECYDLLKQPNNNKMYFLGYDFYFGKDDVKISPSKKRIDRYKNRLKMTFAQYQKEKKHNEKRARKTFIKRLRFLTGNTKLRNNKRNALVGIYFSNSLANNLKPLIGLDHYLNHADFSHKCATHIL